MTKELRNKIRELEIADNGWLTFVYKVKSIPAWKIALILIGIVLFIAFNYWLNETLFIRDLILFTK